MKQEIHDIIYIAGGELFAYIIIIVITHKDLPSNLLICWIAVFTKGSYIAKYTVEYTYITNLAIYLSISIYLSIYLSIYK